MVLNYLLKLYERLKKTVETEMREDEMRYRGMRETDTHTHTQRCENMMMREQKI